MTLYTCRCKSDVRYVSAFNSGGVPGWFGLETMKSVRPILICGDGENACQLVKFLHGVLWEWKKLGKSDGEALTTALIVTAYKAL